MKFIGHQWECWAGSAHQHWTKYTLGHAKSNAGCVPTEICMKVLSIIPKSQPQTASQSNVHCYWNGWTLAHSHKCWSANEEQHVPTDTQLHQEKHKLMELWWQKCSLTWTGWWWPRTWYPTPPSCACDLCTSCMYKSRGNEVRKP